MDGPGDYVTDPTGGIGRVEDLPPPQVVRRSRDYRWRPCPRCGQRAYRLRTAQRTLHDLGDPLSGRPRTLEVTYSHHRCPACGHYFNADMLDLPNAHYTHRVMHTAVRLVVEDGLPIGRPVGTCGAITASLSLSPGGSSARTGPEDAPRGQTYAGDVPDEQSGADGLSAVREVGLTDRQRRGGSPAQDPGPSTLQAGGHALAHPREPPTSVLCWRMNAYYPLWTTLWRFPVRSGCLLADCGSTLVATRREYA